MDLEHVQKGMGSTKASATPAWQKPMAFLRGAHDAARIAYRDHYAAREAAAEAKDSERADNLIATKEGAIDDPRGATEPRSWSSGEAGSDSIGFSAFKQRRQWGQVLFPCTYHLVDRKNGVFDVFRARSVRRYDSPIHMAKNEFFGSVVAFRELP